MWSFPRCARLTRPSRRLRTVALAVLVVGALIVPQSPVAAAAPTELEQATQAVQGHINAIAKFTSPSWCATWVGAQPASPPDVYHGLTGRLLVYWFRVQKDGRAVGSIAVGSAFLGFRTMTAGPMQPPSLPSNDRVKQIVARDLKMDISKIAIADPVRRL